MQDRRLFGHQLPFFLQQTSKSKTPYISNTGPMMERPAQFSSSVHYLRREYNIQYFVKKSGRKMKAVFYITKFPDA